MRFGHKLIRLLLPIVLLSSLAIAVLPMQQTNAMTGNGTVGNPFLIYDVNDLQAMSNNLTAYYELANDIDASATSGWNGGLGFAPIGTYSTPFVGSFDGQGFTVDGLFINRTVPANVGLFGRVGMGGVISNITLTNVNMTGVLVTDGTDGGAGGLVGWLYKASISRGYTSGTINATGAAGYAGGLVGVARGDASVNSTISDSGSSASVSSIGNAGGLLGGVYGSYAVIIRSFATGAVTATGNAAGGFVGLVDYPASFSQSYATGTVTGGAGGSAGGFVGYAHGEGGGVVTFLDSYAKGASTGGTYTAGFMAIGYVSSGGSIYVTNSYSTGTATGGTTGGLIAPYFIGSGSTVTNSFWDTQTSGQASSDGGTGKTTAQMKTESTFTDAGWDFVSIWDIDGITNNGYPYLPNVLYVPTVTTQAASGIGTITATGNGNITDTGGENSDERGFEWDTDSGAPYTNNVTVSGNFTTGAYTGNLTGLPPGNIIYYRAMAHNSAGWGYGSELTFNTNYLYEMSVWVDGVEVATVLTNDAIPNTSSNWTFASGNTTLYLTRQRIWLGGSLKQDISWQYSPTEPVYLYDASGNGNTATPTLRTSGSSANVTANLTSFAPITPTTSDPTNPAITADNLTAPFDEPPNLYSELNLSFPGAALINELLDGANIPRALFWFPIIFGLLNLIGLAIYALTKSIMIQGIVMGFLIILASLMGGFGYWVAIEFTIMAIAITIASRQYGW